MLYKSLEKKTIKKSIFEKVFSLHEILYHFLVPSIYTYYQMKDQCRDLCGKGASYPESENEESSETDDVLRKALGLMNNKETGYRFIREMTKDELLLFQQQFDYSTWILSAVLLDYFGTETEADPEKLLSLYPYRKYRDAMETEVGEWNETMFQNMCLLAKSRNRILIDNETEVIIKNKYGYLTKI